MEGCAICGYRGENIQVKEGVTHKVALLLYLDGLKIGDAQVKITSSQWERKGRTVVLIRFVG